MVLSKKKVFLKHFVREELMTKVFYLQKKCEIRVTLTYIEMEFKIKHEQPTRKQIREGTFRTVEELGKFKNDKLMASLEKAGVSIFDLVNSY
jgi:hypothetical protein